MVKMKTEATVEREPVAITFSKKKLLGFKRYANRVDLLKTLLMDERTYTTLEVDAVIENFMKGQAN